MLICCLQENIGKRTPESQFSNKFFEDELCSQILVSVLAQSFNFYVNIGINASSEMVAVNVSLTPSFTVPGMYKKNTHFY